MYIKSLFVKKKKNNNNNNNNNNIDMFYIDGILLIFGGHSHII